MANAYDEVAYPSAVYPRTHPAVLAAIATLSGLQPAPAERCRVLELACGDGLNLIAMAYGLPGSQFVGLDLAAAPIARGAAMIETLGLKNVTLQARDVTTVAATELGEFDYIIAHGFYSWAPAPVREKIMEICGRHLSAHGVAYISYNAYPGNHIRDITRGIMRYHAAHFPDPVEQIGQARGLLRLIAGAGEPNEIYRQIVVFEEDRIRELSNAHLRHDDLSPCNQPFYFHEFMTAAQSHGLQFLGEADFEHKREHDYSPEVRAALAQLDPEDIVTCEQYRDFLGGRAFRRTLLCRQALPVNRIGDLTRMNGLFLAGEVRSTGVTLDQASAQETEVFENIGNVRMETDQPVAKAALRRIGAAWPAFVSFPDLLAQVQQDLPDQPVPGDDLASAVLAVAIVGGVELRTCPPSLAPAPSARPRASALAHLQARNAQARFATLLHQTVEIDDEISRQFLNLLDGTRDRAELRQAALDHIPGTDDSLTEDHIEQVLQRIARLGLLEA